MAQARPQTEPADDFGRPDGGWRLRCYRIIFESDTRAGRLFDLLLLALILISVGVVMLDSVASLHERHARLFNGLEWLFTALFSIEYALRLLCVRQPLRYARSFFGAIDLMAVAPTYLAWFFPELAAFIDVRVLRLLRIFRILKLTEYIAEFRQLGSAIHATRRKITVFISFVILVVIVMASLMYVVEGPENGYTSIPVAMYWAITTMTTVGFGDITPKTDLGRIIASLMMLMGWGTLAVPTGIVSAEFAARRIGEPRESRESTRICTACGQPGLAANARYCSQCGQRLMH
jgi:voltage-gated potassium channel